MPARKYSTLLGFLLIFTFFPGWHSITAAAASTLIVPDQFNNISAAIAAAVPGDIVSVRDGTYSGAANTNLDPGGKAITIQSMNGPAACIIDCTGSARAFIVQTGETNSTVISGFTIVDGSDAGGSGAAILLSQTSPLIEGCVFSKNNAQGGGGAIYCDGGYPVITKCTFGTNSAKGWGGAILVDNNGSPSISVCQFQSNSASYGGAIKFANGTVTAATAGAEVRDCWFFFNKASNEGGAIDCSYASPLITGCVIDQNGATIGGGAVSSSGANPTIVNCVITNNTSDQGAALYFISSGSGVVTNCSFSGNQASQTSGALYFADSTVSVPVTVANAILWGDLPTEIVSAAGASGFSVSYSDVSGSYPGTNNINADPQYYQTTDTLNAGRDYHLRPASPCIDRGNNYAPAIPATDKDHCPRIFGAAVDMGAYELQNVTMNATVSIEDNFGTPLSSAYQAQPVMLWLTFNNLSNLEVPADSLMGRTITITFIGDGVFGAGQKLTFESHSVGDRDRNVIAEGLPFGVPLNISPGNFSLTGRIEISGLNCLSNSNSMNSSVVYNTPVSFPYPITLPAAAAMNQPVNAYRMIGCPVIPTPDPDVFTTFSSFFGNVYNPSIWRMFQTDLGSLVEITGSGQDKIKFGKSWWIISSAQKSLSVTGVPMRWDDNHFYTQGYHMVSNPFWDTTMSWQQIVQNNPALGSTSILYEWDGSGNYISATSVVPGKSYWMWCPTDLTLTVKRSYAAAPVKHQAPSTSERTVALPPPAPAGSLVRIADSGSSTKPAALHAAAYKALRQPPPPLPPGAFLQLLSPKGGEKLKGGALVPIRWKSFAISPQKVNSPVRIALSMDGGKTYSIIASNAKNSGTYVWKVPKKVSNNCVIKVSSTLYPSVSGTSAKVFTIR